MNQVVVFLVCIVDVSIMTIPGWRGLRGLGARDRGMCVFAIGEAVGLALCALGVALWAPAIVAVAVGLSFVLSVWPRVVIRLTGGPTPGFGLRLALRDLDRFTVRDPARPATGADREWLQGHLAGLERWRTPATSQLIDLWIKATRDYWFETGVDLATYRDEVADLWRAAESVWGRPPR